MIIATGARPISPDIPGVDGLNVVFAEDVLRGRSNAGMNVLIVGGGMVGSESIINEKLRLILAQQEKSM